MLLGPVHTLLGTAVKIQQQPFLYTGFLYGSGLIALRLSRAVLARIPRATGAVFLCLGEVVAQYWEFRARCADSKTRAMLARRERRERPV
jgi:hypothetical protein